MTAMQDALTPPFSGHCLCGAVSYRCDALPLWQVNCHCESCRRATSSPMTAFLAVADGHWRWTGVEPASFASSPDVTRLFCPRCGSPMAYRNARECPDEMHFYAASLDDPARFHPTAHDFLDERLPWLHLSDGLPAA